MLPTDDDREVWEAVWSFGMETKEGGSVPSLFPFGPWALGEGVRERVVVPEELDAFFTFSPSLADDLGVPSLRFFTGFSFRLAKSVSHNISVIRNICKRSISSRHFLAAREKRVISKPPKPDRHRQPKAPERILQNL